MTASDRARVASADPPQQRPRRKFHAPHRPHSAFNGCNPAKATEAVSPVDDPSDIAGVSGADRTADQCAWPIGDPQSPDFGFCGEETVEGRSYCARHMMRAYDKIDWRPTPGARAPLPSWRRR